MAGPDPAVAAARLAVRRALVASRSAPGALPARPVLVACSGGADSLALLAATVFESREQPWGVVGLTVDHALQDGSAQRAQSVVEQMAAMGADETMTVRVSVEAPGVGPEAAARQARYAALSQAAERLGSGLVLLGHTLDDQAETVLLGLTRGSGGRSIAGMRRRYTEGGVVFARPLVDLTRAETEQACRAEGIHWWDDPHNHDPRFTRSRLRRRVLPVLEEELGPGVAGSLARTADLLQQDLAALDQLADDALVAARTADGGLDTVLLGTHPAAIFARVLRRAAVAAGARPAELGKHHVDALVELMHGAHAAGRAAQVQLPGHVTAYLGPARTMRFRRT